MLPLGLATNIIEILLTSFSESYEPVQPSYEERLSVAKPGNCHFQDRINLLQNKTN